MPKQTLTFATSTFVTFILIVAATEMSALAAEGVLCLTPQVTEFDELKRIKIEKFTNENGTIVIDKGDMAPLPPITFREFQLAFGDDAWTAKDSLPGDGGKIRIGVAFLNGTDFQKAAVKKYASEWLVASGAGNIDFVFGDTSRKHIRISFEVAPNFNQSLIGRQATMRTDPSAATMQLGDVREDVAVSRMQGVIRHEFGHALGMRHEHQHPDAGIKWNKPNVVADLSAYGWSNQKVQTNIFDVLTRSYVCRGAPTYDTKSIMIYPISADWTLDGYAVVANTEIVEADLKCVHSLYE